MESIIHLESVIVYQKVFSVAPVGQWFVYEWMAANLQAVRSPLPSATIILD